MRKNSVCETAHFFGCFANQGFTVLPSYGPEGKHVAKIAQNLPLSRTDEHLEELLRISANEDEVNFNEVINEYY